VVVNFSNQAEALVKKFRIKNQYESVQQMLKAGGMVDALVILYLDYIYLKI
jgi:predicted dehydrogenase